MTQRKHERVALDTESTLYFPDKKDFLCQTLDVSVGGMKITCKKTKDLFSYIGSDCLIEFLVDIQQGVETKQIFLQAKAQIVNGDLKGVGLAFKGADKETLVLIEKLVVSNLHEDDLIALKAKEGVRIKPNYARHLKSQLGEHITDSVKEIFIAFLSMDVTAGPYVERPDFNDYQPPDTEVTAIIMFSGAIEGGVHLASPLHFAIQAAAAMLGEDSLEFDKEQEDMVWDAVGEIANQVAGGIQTRISGGFDEINLSSPNVITGPNFCVNYSKKLTSVRQFFKSPIGPFYIECFFS